MTEKKQAVFVRIPGNHPLNEMQAIAQDIQKTLQQHFDKEIVVLMFTEDIHLMTQSDITNLIDTLENITK